MTIIVGIICKNGIVIASDSQTTFGSSKRCDAEKVEIVVFKNEQTLVAKSGNDTLGSRAIEILADLARNEEITDYRHGADIAEKAVRQIRNYEANLYPNASEEWLQKHFRDDCPFELLMAYYCNGKPFIFSISVIDCSAKLWKSYAAIGCAANLGIYLLKEYSETDIDAELATVLAIHIVDIAKANDAFCGGSTKVGLLRLLPRNLFPLNEPLVSSACILPQDAVDELGEIAADVDSKSKEERREIISKRLRERTARIMLELFHLKHPLEGAELL